MKHVTIKDVAKALNCSISTVSRAHNDKYDIRAKTRKKILKVSKEMGYYPNPMARKLIQKKSYNIGVVVPEFLNSFFPKVIIGMQKTFNKRGYQVIILQSSEKSSIEIKNLKTLVNNFVDGIAISLTNDSNNLDFINELIERKLPLVLFNRVPFDLDVSKVIFDDYKMSFFATEHLIRENKKNLVYLSGPPNLSLSKERKKGFIDACKKHKIDIPKENIISTDFSIEDGARIVKKLHLDHLIPEGIVCVNDHVAIGAIGSLKKNNYKIPEDVAVIGFTKSVLGSHIHPKLSTVEQPLKKMGKQIAEMLLEQIESEVPIPNKTVVMNGKLLYRASSTNKKNTY